MRARNVPKAGGSVHLAHRTRLVIALAGCLLTAFASLGCNRTAKTPSPAPAAPPKPALKAPPPTPIQEKKEELGGSTWQTSWTVLVEKGLPPEMMGARAARAVHSYCPRFAEESEADKRAFWAYLFQALAGAEAGLNPRADVHHLDPTVNRIDPVTHVRIHQDGLLQLTYEDGQRYGCDFDWQHDRHLPEHSPERTILNPANNLSCGIRIMDNQIITKGEPLLTRHSYWGTLHPGTMSYRVFAKQMENVPEACGLHARTTRRKSRPERKREIAARRNTAEVPRGQ